MNTTIETVLARLQRVKKTRGGYIAICPAHDDHRPSLSITAKPDGILLHCFAGCDPRAVAEALGLKISDLFEHNRVTDQRQSTPIATYDYRDAGGKLLYQVVRFEPKSFAHRRPDGKGGWIWNLKGVRLVPFRLPQVIAAVRAGEHVFVAEGEKDVLALISLGLVATTNSGGAGKWRKQYSQYFKGANVVILPDNDEPGKAHAEDVARNLASTASSVKIVNLPGLPDKGDVCDWLALGGTKEELLALVEAAREWSPLHVRQQVSDIAGFPLTDLGNAERLIVTYGPNLRFDVDSGHWLIWSGKRWQYDATGKIYRLAAKVIRRMYDALHGLDKAHADELYAHAKKSESKPRLEAMVSLAEKLAGVPVTSCDLDADPWLFNVLNGTIDLRTGTLRPHAREDMLTKLAPVEYDPNATAPRWEQFLREVFDNDEATIAFVRRMLGYCLTGDTREECVFVLTGKGENGKSKFAEAVRAVLGDYAGDTPFSTFIERRDSNTSDLAALRGKRLVTASEADQAHTFNESLLKKCTGGDTITCRHLYREYFSYIPTWKVIFSTNEVPRIHSQNRAIKRRMKLIAFRVTFHAPEEGREPVRDDQLLPKLLAEKNGILRWAVEGCLEWQKIGLDTPRAIQQEVEKFFESQDPLAEFIDAECVIRPGAEVEVGVLWQRYLSWCEEAKRQPAFKQTHVFSRALIQRDGIESKRGAGGVRMLAGIGLSDPGSDASDAKTNFSEKSPMNGKNEHFSENTDLASLSVTNERENGVSDGGDDTDVFEKTPCYFDSEEDFDSLAALAPRENTRHGSARPARNRDNE